MVNMIKLRLSKATAIITAILIVSVISIAAITLQAYLYGEFKRTQMVIDGDRMLNGLYDVEAWGLATLSNVQDKNLREVNQYDFRENNLSLSGSIHNQNGLFNLNYLYSAGICRSKALTVKEQVLGTIFGNILKTSGIKNLNEGEAEKIIKNIREFICYNSDTKYDGVKEGENSFDKINNSWGYQNTGQIFVDKSELKLVPGISYELYNKISNKIAVFPIDIKNDQVQVAISANDLSPDFLAALAGVDVDEAKNFLEENIYTNDAVKAKQHIDKLKKLIADKNIYIEEELSELNKFFATDSSNTFYRITGQARLDDYIMKMHTMVNIDKKINIVWRKRSLAYG